MLIDSHCHLSDGRFREDLEETVKRAVEAGVEKMIVPATDLEDSRRVIDLTEKYEQVYGVVGVHPSHAQEIFNLQDSIFKLKGIISSSPKIAGIGEIGMDGYWNRRNLNKQAEVFKAQLELAVELNKPAVIHSRDSGEEIKEVLDSLRGSSPKGQFHCFGESEEFLDYILEKGFYVSFCGNITYKSAESLRILAKRVPLERLLLETDAPYLPPEGTRGQRNEPANVRITAEFLANLKDISFEELVKITTENARSLFGL